MSHYTINARSNPDLQRLAQKANRERSRTLKQWLLRLTNYLRRTRRRPARAETARSSLSHQNLPTM
jgi:hypothetical protein